MPLRSKDSEIELMLQLLSEAYEKKTWHGPNLKQSIRGVSARGAAWRPASGRHNIWELTLHAAYWKYAVRRRLIGLPQGSFALKGSNFFAMPDRTPMQSGAAPANSSTTSTASSWLPWPIRVIRAS
jgi:hypothetical protein